MCNKTRAKRQDAKTKPALKRRQQVRRILEDKQIDNELVYLYTPGNLTPEDL